MAGEENDGGSAVADGEGESLGAAKWSAIKALEPSFPGIEADDVEFEVLDAGDEEAGRPARVRARVDESRWDETDADELPEEPAEGIRARVLGGAHAPACGHLSTSSRPTTRSPRPSMARTSAC